MVSHGQVELISGNFHTEPGAFLIELLRLNRRTGKIYFNADNIYDAPARYSTSKQVILRS